jgi:hypothetical protein
MTVLAALSRTSSVWEPLCRDVDEFLDLVVCDLPSGDITGRLKRLAYVRDRLNLAFSKDAARLAAEFREVETANWLDATTAGEWIRHNCKMKSGAAYDCINVGEQVPRIAKCEQAMVAGEIGFAHLSVIARTASAHPQPHPNLSSTRMTSSSTPANRQPDGCGITANAYAMRSTRKALSRIIVLRSRSDVSGCASGKTGRCKSVESWTPSAERHYAPPSSRWHSRRARATIAASSAAWAMDSSNCRFIRSMLGWCPSTRASAHTSRLRHRSKRSRHCRDRRRRTWSFRLRFHQ